MARRSGVEILWDYLMDLWTDPEWIDFARKQYELQKKTDEEEAKQFLFDVIRIIMRFIKESENDGQK